MEATSLRKSLRVPLLQALSGRSLSSFADAALFSNARILSEGVAVEGEAGERVYSGSTMLSVGLRDSPSIDCGDASDEELREMASRSIGFHVRLIRLARSEAERRSAPFLPREMRCELAFRVEGGVLFVDIDLECPLAAPRPGADGAQGGAP